MDSLEPRVYLWGATVFGPLQALVTMWSYLGGLTTGGSFAEVKSPSENLANLLKRLSMTKTNFKKVTGSRIISWEFSEFS